MTLRVLEITPGGTANFHERWNRLGIYATEVSFENAVETITTTGTTELVVDAVVIRQATYASIRLSDQIRSLSDSVAMIDGKKWCSVPIIILASATRERPGGDVLDEEGDVKVREVVLVEPDDNYYGADEIKENVEDYRLSALSYLALLPIKRSPTAIDKKFVEYLLELSEGVTGRIIEVLRRAALQGIADKTQKVGLVQLQAVGAKMPSVVGQLA